MWSAICFNLDQSKILSSGNGFMHFYTQDLDESSIEDEVEAEEKEVSSEQFSGQFSEDCQAGEATPISMPSGLDTDNSVSSPEEGASKPVVEVFDLQESSSEDISPDMEAQALFVKLKEVNHHFRMP